VRGGAATSAERGVDATRVERVAAEPDGQRFELELRVELAAVLAALAHQVQDLRRSTRHEGPRLFQIGLIEGVTGRASLQHRPPQAQRERARATFERVHGGGALT
jgi:hypothetical protein